MLARLSIRDIVLIERLDIEFSRGLAVLTGETGAGKSILLDAFALALGGRGDAGLVRHGVEQGQVTAVFDVPKGHPAAAILSDNGLDDESNTGEMILRRVQLADGRTRAFINDQAISVQTLKAVGSALVEIHGQHDERALVDAVDPSAAARCVCRPRKGRRCAGAAVGRAGAPPTRCSTSIAPAWSAPPARPTICATPPTN